MTQLGERGGAPKRRLHARRGLTLAFVSLLLFSGYGTLVPHSIRCDLPGQVGCPGGLLGAPATTAASVNEQFFNVTMPDYSFWVINTVDGSNETNAWYLYEGWTVHINATSLKPDPSQSGEAYHGLGMEINETGRQLLDLAAPVGKWSAGTFVVPSGHAYYHQHIWCTVYCGPGHGGQELFNVMIVPATFVPTASATADVTKGPAPLTVHFTGNASGGTSPLKASWNFGDGTATASTLIANHTYTANGNYSAVLTVTDAKGFKATHVTPITVTSSAPLALTASVTPTSGVAPVAATLQAAATGGIPPYAYSWTLGDGTNATGASLTHLYSATGSFGVVVTVKDAAGSKMSKSLSIVVQSSKGSFPVTATATPQGGAAPSTVTFTATASGGAAPYAYTWLFGDGAFGSGGTATHTYTVPGLYEAVVYASDAAGKTGRNLTAASVIGSSTTPLTARLLETPSGGSPPLTITGSVSMEGGSGSYNAAQWSFGDGTTGTGSVVTHTYSALGDHNLSVTVSDSAGGKSTASTTVRVLGFGISIGLNRTTGDTPFSVSASASIVAGTGIYNPVTWTWGDGTTSVGKTENHTYAPTLNGTVTITANVTDSSGNKTSSAVSVTIDPLPVATLVANAASTTLLPTNVTFTLTLHGGSGNYSTNPLWSFGDGMTTRGPSPQSHTYVRAGHYIITVQTNDSNGGKTVGKTWLNLSNGNLGGTTGGPPVWTFNGVNDPDAAALALLMLFAASGLFVLYHRQLGKPLPTPPPTPPRGATAPRPAGGTATPRPTAPRGRA